MRNFLELEKMKDHRGFLVQYLTNSELDSKKFGTLYMVHIAPKMVRACHFHKRKWEWLWVAHGKCEFVLQDVKTKEEAKIISDSSVDKVVRITIAPFVAHGIKNLLDDVSIVIGYASEEYDFKDPDTYPYKLRL